MLAKNNNIHPVMIEQIDDVEKCLIHFESFMRAATTPQTVPETLHALCGDVQSAENAADIALRRMIDSLSKGSYLPSTREDIIDLSTSCDKIANKCETIAKIIVFEKIRLPESYTKDIMEILSITHEQFELLEESISMLLGKKYAALAQDSSILDKIRSLESAVDRIEDKIIEDIFGLDIELAAKSQLANVIHLLGDVSDKIEDIADKIQIMLISRKA